MAVIKWGCLPEQSESSEKVQGAAVTSPDDFVAA